MKKTPIKTMLAEAMRYGYEKVEFLGRIHDVSVFEGVYKGVGAVCVFHAWGADLPSITQVINTPHRLGDGVNLDGKDDDVIDPDPKVTWHDVRKLLLRKSKLLHVKK